MESFIFEEKDYVQTTPKKPKPISYTIDLLTGCWNCISHFSSNKDGYPHIKRNGKSYNAYRYIWLISKGEIPKGIVVRHKCDNVKCINPEHLELGSDFENIKDSISRGRRSLKLSESDVNEIRLSALSHASLARKYSVSATHIIYIRQSKSRTKVL